MGAIKPKAFGLPDNAEIFVRVPGGADWSNTDLDLDDSDRPLVVRTTHRTHMQTG